MADHVDITLWIDRRWKDAIEKHLKDETLQEHLEDVLDEMCNQLPEREYERISAEIYAEDVAEREAREAARTYAAYHVVENGQEWYFKTSPGEELLDAAVKLRGYVTAEKGSAPDLFIKLFADGQPITAEEYNALTALRMENTGKVRGVFDLNFDKREFSAVHIMDGWQTWAMRDVSVAAYHATRSQFASSDDQWRKLLDHLSGKEITSAGHLSARIFSFGDEIIGWTASSIFMCRRSSMWTQSSAPSSVLTRTMTSSTSTPTMTSRRIGPATRWSCASAKRTAQRKTGTTSSTRRSGRCWHGRWMRSARSRPA